MSSDESYRPRWRLGVLAALALAALSLYPQLDLWRAHPEGALSTYATVEFDEVCYSAYVNALVDGRPRRNDPYTARSDSPATPLAENYFSVQFIPAYLLALPARLFGLSASHVFLLLAPLAAFASALALFRLLASITEDDRIACAGTIFVLSLGALAGTPAAVRTLLHLHNPFTQLPFLPFLRRYVPAVPFPCFLIFCALVLRALACDRARAAARRAIPAGLALSSLVFSYFYLWTAALAWLACLAALWLSARPRRRRPALAAFGVVAAFALASLVPYALLLTHRAGGENSLLMLRPSHAPDLLRETELLAALVLFALAVAAWRRIVNWKDGAFLSAASFALAPFVCFNQQVATGLTIQAVHYEKLVANYCALVALVVAAVLAWRGLKGASAPPRAVLVAVALASLCWAGAEVFTQSRLNRRYETPRAETQPLAARLRELARGVPADRLADQVVVFSPALMHIHADTLPTDAPQPVLWAEHMFVFSGMTWREYKERLYQNLYFTGIDAPRLDALARGEGVYIRFVFFSYRDAPVTRATISEEVESYRAYAASFDRERAARARLAYLVTAEGEQVDLSNLERWYERDAGERVGALVLYRLRPRP